MIRQLAALRERVLDGPPTGTIEPNRSHRAPGMEVLDGRAVLRAMHPELWRWAVDNDLVRPGLFGAGDGTTTFVLPDFRGRLTSGGTPINWLIHT